MQNLRSVSAPAFLLHPSSRQSPLRRSLSTRSWARPLVAASDNVQCFCLHAHFTASVFSWLVCGSPPTGSGEVAVVHGVRQRQQRTLRTRGRPWPWPGNLLRTLPGWRVSSGKLQKSTFSQLHFNRFVYLCKVTEKIHLWFIIIIIHIWICSLSTVTLIILY